MSLVMQAAGSCRYLHCRDASSSSCLWTSSAVEVKSFGPLWRCCENISDEIFSLLLHWQKHSFTAFTACNIICERGTLICHWNLSLIPKSCYRQWRQWKNISQWRRRGGFLVGNFFAETTQMTIMLHSAGSSDRKQTAHPWSEYFHRIQLPARRWTYFNTASLVH